MALELIVNLLLLAGGIFCFVNVSTTMPHSAVNELGAEQWPQAILVLMLIALAFNIVRYFKINKKRTSPPRSRISSPPSAALSRASCLSAWCWWS